MNLFVNEWVCSCETQLPWHTKATFAPNDLRLIDHFHIQRIEWKQSVGASVRKQSHCRAPGSNLDCSSQINELVVTSLPSPCLAKTCPQLVLCGVLWMISALSPIRLLLQPCRASTAIIHGSLGQRRTGTFRAATVKATSLVASHFQRLVIAAAFGSHFIALVQEPPSAPRRLTVWWRSWTRTIFITKRHTATTSMPTHPRPPWSPMSVWANPCRSSITMSITLHTTHIFNHIAITPPTAMLFFMITCLRGLPPQFQPRPLQAPCRFFHARRFGNVTNIRASSGRNVSGIVTWSDLSSKAMPWNLWLDLNPRKD